MSNAADGGVQEMLTLAGGNVSLRDFVDGDWEAVHDYASQEETVRFVSWGPNDEGASRSFVSDHVREAANPDRAEYNLAVVLNATGEVVGGCNINIDDRVARKGNIGYCISPRVWRTGVGTEVGRLLVGFGFGVLGLHRIWATCDPRNVGSKRVLEKAGMALEGLLRDDMLAHGTYRDSYLFAILEDEWRGGEPIGPH